MSSDDGWRGKGSMQVIGKVGGGPFATGEVDNFAEPLSIQEARDDPRAILLALLGVFFGKIREEGGRS